MHTYIHTSEGAHRITFAPYPSTALRLTSGAVFGITVVVVVVAVAVSKGSAVVVAYACVVCVPLTFRRSVRHHDRRLDAVGGGGGGDGGC